MGQSMQGQINKAIKKDKRQRQLRRNMTIAERKLWFALRLGQMKGYKFRRQHPFENFILDFVCLENRLVIEVDGSQHLDAIAYDQQRTKVLAAAGFLVLRFWNNQILNEFEVVTETIWRTLETHPLPVLPLEGEGTPSIDVMEYRN